MPIPGLGETVVGHAALAALLLLALWPRVRTGERLLRVWAATDEPAENQARLAAGYLRQRRIMVAVLFVLAPLVPYVASGGVQREYNDLGTDSLVGSLLAALLVAELVAALRGPRGSTRMATLAPRRWRDLVPVYAVVLFGATTTIAVGAATAVITVQPWAARAVRTEAELHPVYAANLANGPGWFLLGCALLTGAAVWLVVRLATTRRPLDGADDPVDRALRVRSARVALGIGLAATATIAISAAGWLSFAVGMLDESAPGWLLALDPVHSPLAFALILVGGGGWSWVANPPRRVLSRPTA